MAQGKKSKPLQNLISENVFKESDLAEREREVVGEISQETGFRPLKLLGRSSWWGSKHIGAFHYSGEFEGKPATLKVQGVKPTTSEIYMIESFAAQNKSKVIRPPLLYKTLPWDKNKRYEALVMESVGKTKVISVPTNRDEINRFYKLFNEYRKKCRNDPWLEKPFETIAAYTKANFKKWRKASFEIYPKHPLRKAEDKNLIDEAVAILEKGYEGVEWDFQHAHLSDSDLYKAGDQIVVLSNLYWSWRAPFYDAIFCYHWFMYHLADVDISPEKVEEQRTLWLDTIHNLFQVQGVENQRLLNLALLERAAAGLNLDALSVKTDKPLAKYLVDSTRIILKNLIEEIE